MPLTASTPARPHADPTSPDRLAGTTSDGEHPRLVDHAHRFAQAVVEAVAGDRPCTQLLRWTNGPVYAELTAQVTTRPRGVRSTPAARSRVLSVKVCRPRAGVAEVAAHVRQGRRSRALAARLEGSGPRWICTALELG